jgi:hypothetical protein
MTLFQSISNPAACSSAQCLAFFEPPRKEYSHFEVSEEEWAANRTELAQMPLAG